MGGVTYARNLLKALNTLDDKDKPFIDVYCRSIEAFEDLQSHTGYPYLDKVIINDDALYKKIFRKLVKFIRGYEAKCKINRFDIKPEDEMLFPYGMGSESKKLVYWRPDFQEKYLPEYFNAKNIKERDRSIRFVASQNIPIVFSSHDSEKDFKKFYPEYTNPTFVVHFAVDHADFSYLNIDDVKKKYKIKGDYLLCANQFWMHKNHLFLFSAYKKALNKGFDKPLVCTGALSDYRNPEYINEIKRFIADNHLERSIILPGLIGSDELHCLMKNAYAVVQPSLFEGWNTTVEDCKALNTFVFLSDLGVHKEQVDKNVCFFNPRVEDDLVQKLLTVVPRVEPYDYSFNLRKFGQDFLNVIQYVIGKTEGTVSRITEETWGQVPVSEYLRDKI